MSQGERVAGVFPTRMALTQFKGKVKAATKGYELLKRKSDALTVELRSCMTKLALLKKTLGAELSSCNLALASAEYSAGDFKTRVLTSNHVAQIRLTGETTNIAGVKIPKFIECLEDNEDLGGAESIGLGRGGKAIDDARNKYRALVTKLIQVASYQTAFLKLNEALKVCNRRVNALENVVVPRLTNTKDYILAELDELEREDFTRLKKVVSMNKEVYEKEEAARAELTEDVEGDDIFAGSDIADAHDPDVIFG